MNQEIVRVAHGVYRVGKLDLIKVDKNCWRITNKGYGIDFENLENAVSYCITMQTEGWSSEARSQELS